MSGSTWRATPIPTMAKALNTCSAISIKTVNKTSLSQPSTPNQNWKRKKLLRISLPSSLNAARPTPICTFITTPHTSLLPSYVSPNAMELSKMRSISSRNKAFSLICSPSSARPFASPPIHSQSNPSKKSSIQDTATMMSQPQSKASSHSRMQLLILQMAIALHSKRRSLIFANTTK